MVIANPPLAEAAICLGGVIITLHLKWGLLTLIYEMIINI